MANSSEKPLQLQAPITGIYEVQFLLPKHGVLQLRIVIIYAVLQFNFTAGSSNLYAIGSDPCQFYHYP
jgi:hypothetical protein